MGLKYLELYLDESGDFNEGKENHSPSETPSMVGGLLCSSGWMTQERIREDFHGQRSHACSKYKSSYLPLLQKAKDDGCRFVVFENTEKIRVINSDFTYINIISEGLVHLFQDLQIEFQDGVSLKVVVAQRGMSIKEYETRLKEKVIMALGRNHLDGMDYELKISDARTDRRLNYPDLICNTWFTKDRTVMKNGTATAKFDPEQRALIRDLYDTQWIYSVFHDVAFAVLNQLLTERHYGEAMFKICTLSRQRAFLKAKNKVIRGIEAADTYEQDTWFTQMSLLIGQYNRLWRYKDGIEIAENYIRYFLGSLKREGHLKEVIPFWLFDTYYYLLTMYEHIGNTTKCQEYLRLCNDNIVGINQTWEHIDYYFGFRIRELNVLMGRFAFSDVLRRAKELEQIFLKARDWFSLIQAHDSEEKTVRSELLGKVYGVQLEAAINLLRLHPEMYGEAEALSDKAIAEFVDFRDISRQYQMRCLLLVESQHPREAYRLLLKSVGAEDGEPSVQTFLEKAFALPNGAYDFHLWHFSNVMLLLMEKQDPFGRKMFEALKKDHRFWRSLDNEEKGGHPWNLVLWNAARCFRMERDHASYMELYRRAVAISCENKDKAAMMTFAISMSAEQLLWYRRNGKWNARNATRKGVEKAEREFEEIIGKMEKAGLTEEMQAAFRLSECVSGTEISDDILAEIANAYLK